jgi:plasmid stabilization system protein ParE
VDEFPDLGSLSDQELKDLVRRLRADEHQISYRRRLLQGRIDILRAELERRLRRAAEEGDPES